MTAFVVVEYPTEPIPEGGYVQAPTGVLVPYIKPPEAALTDDLFDEAANAGTPEAWQNLATLLSLRIDNALRLEHKPGAGKEHLIAALRGRTSIHKQEESLTKPTGSFVAMTHEYDGGLCWCGPKCDPPGSLPSDRERAE